MPRVGQRRLIPFSSQSRHLDVVQKTDTIEDSATLAAGADTVFSMTTASQKGIPIFVQEDISLFESSISEANLIPNGSSITTSDYQIIGPWREQVAGDEKNIVSKIYVRNNTLAATDFAANSAEDGDKSTAIAWNITDINTLTGKDSSDPSTDIEKASRFTNVTIPQGATINSATLTFTAQSTFGSNVLVKIYGIDEDDTASIASDPTGRDKTTANTDWDQNGRIEDQEYVTPSIVDIVQEIVDRGGWSSGNALGFLIVNDGSANENSHSWYGAANGSKVPVLDVNYTSGSTKTVLFQGRTRYITPRRDVTIT